MRIHSISLSGREDNFFFNAFSPIWIISKSSLTFKELILYKKCVYLIALWFLFNNIKMLFTY